MVTVIDASADTVLTTIATGAGPRSMCRRAATGRTYVCDRSGPSVSVIRDSVPAAVEQTPQGMQFRDQGPTFCRGTFPLRGGRAAVLVDASGREVLDLHPGDNDVRRLAPSVYFVRREDGSSTAKVVVQR